MKLTKILKEIKVTPKKPRKLHFEEVKQLVHDGILEMISPDPISDPVKTFLQNILNTKNLRELNKVLVDDWGYDFESAQTTIINYIVSNGR
jgi:hypothetical protein